MELYGIELPEPIRENTLKAMRIARNIHQYYANRRGRNTKLRKWHKYWVEIYDLVLEELYSSRKAKNAYHRRNSQ